MKKAFLLAFVLVMIGTIYVSQTYAGEAIMKERYAVGGEIISLNGPGFVINPAVILIGSFVLIGLGLLASKQVKLTIK